MYSIFSPEVELSRRRNLLNKEILKYSFTNWYLSTASKLSNCANLNGSTFCSVQVTQAVGGDSSQLIVYCLL